MSHCFRESNDMDKDDAFFVVLNSQEESCMCQSPVRDLLKTLPALNRKQDIMQLLNSDVKAKSILLSSDGNQQTSDDPAEQASGSGQNQQGQSLGGAGAGHDDGDNQHGAGGAGSGNSGQGGGGSGGGDGGNGDEQHDDDDDDDDDDHEEEGQPSLPSTSSSNNSGTSSVPELIRPSASDRTPPRVAPTQHHLGESSVPVGEQSGTPLGTGDNPIEISESEGGISDAPTAVVSDTEGHGQVIGERSQLSRDLSSSSGGMSGHDTVSPGVSPPGGVTSSALSTLSSFSSTSSSTGKEAETMRPPRKRPPGKSFRGPHKKKQAAEADQSSETDNTSTTTTTTTTTSTTASDTCGNRSHDTSDDHTPETSADTSGDQTHNTSDGGSRDTSHGRSRDASGESSHDKPAGDVGHQCSQQDMFVDNRDQVTESKGQQGDESILQYMSCTPAEKVSSLSFSGQSVLLPETMDDGSQSQSIIPPSQDTYNPVPLLIPSTPTADIIDSQRSTKKLHISDQLEESTEAIAPKSESLHLSLTNTEQGMETSSVHSPRKNSRSLQVTGQACSSPRSSHTSERTLTADAFSLEASSSWTGAILSDTEVKVRDDITHSQSSRKMTTTEGESSEMISNVTDNNQEGDFETTQDLALRMTPTQEPSPPASEGELSKGQYKNSLDNTVESANAVVPESLIPPNLTGDSQPQDVASQNESSFKLQLMCTEADDRSDSQQSSLQLNRPVLTSDSQDMGDMSTLSVKIKMIKDSSKDRDDKSDEDVDRFLSSKLGYPDKRQTSNVGTGSTNKSSQLDEKTTRTEPSMECTIYELDTESVGEDISCSKSDKAAETENEDSMTQLYDYTRLIDRSHDEVCLGSELLDTRSKTDQDSTSLRDKQREGNADLVKGPQQPPSKEAECRLSEQLAMTKSASKQSNNEGRMADGQAVTDPYDYRMSQSQNDKLWRDQVIRLAEKTRLKMANKHDESLVPGDVSVSTVNLRNASTQIIQDSIQDTTEGAMSGHSYHTVTIKTVYCHTVTLQEERIGGRTVNSRVISQHFKTMSQTVETTDDSFSSSSPSNARHSLSSGNLGDISSIEASSAATSHMGSNIASPLSSMDQGTSATTASPSLSKSTSGSDAAQQTKGHGILVTSQHGGSGSGQRRRPIRFSGPTRSLDGTDKGRSKNESETSPRNEVAGKGLAEEATGDQNTSAAVDGAQKKSGASTQFFRKNRISGFVHPEKTLIPGGERTASLVNDGHQKETKTEGSTGTDKDADVVMDQRKKDVMDTDVAPSAGKRKRQVSKDSSPESCAIKRQVTVQGTGNDKQCFTPRTASLPSDGDVSPEIPITGEIKLTPRSASHDTVPATLNIKNLKTGTPVFAMWKDKHYYPAHITEALKNKYMVSFEDGDTCQVKEADVIVCDLLPKGQEVLASRNGGDFEMGVISDLVYKDGRKGSIVKFYDKVSKFVTRKQIILDPEQAKDFKKSLCGENDSAATQDMEATSQRTNELKVIGEIVLIPHKSGKSSKGETSKASSDSDVGMKTQQTSEQLDENRNVDKSNSVSAMIDNYMPFQPYLALLSLVPVGTPVYAMWRDKHFYPGVIKSKVEGMDKYEIEFDDGDIHLVKECDLIVCELVTIGQEVFAERRAAEGHEPGVVIGYYKQGSVVGYTVEFTDMKQERIPRAHVILRLEQARSLIADIRGPGSSPRKSAADVSLENLIDGKRRRVTPGRDKENSNRKGFQSDDKRTKSKEKSESSKKKNKLLTPSATSTPTPKRRDVAIHLDNSPSLTRLLNDSPQRRPSPRKSRAALFMSEIKGPIPDRGSSLFCGITFILTFVDKSSEKPNQCGSSSNLSKLTEDEEVPFDKEYLQEQIVAGGGIILDQFDKNKVQAAKCCYLISNTCHRTIKYFCSLAIGIPCLSHVWIRDACHSGKCPDVTSYLLPAGYNIEKKRFDDWSDHRGGLHDLNICLTSKNKTFVSLWQLVLDCSPCNVITKLPSPKKAKSMKVHVISDHLCDRQVAAQVQQLGLPHLSSEWIIQCLISGKRVSYSGHPKYRWDYQE